ncbi:MAG: hypothetical protein AB7E32_10590, partial [Desulfovibrio sp.]
MKTSKQKSVPKDVLRYVIFGSEYDVLSIVPSSKLSIQDKIRTVTAVLSCIYMSTEHVLSRILSEAIVENGLISNSEYEYVVNQFFHIQHMNSESNDNLPGYANIHLWHSWRH